MLRGAATALPRAAVSSAALGAELALHRRLRAGPIAAADIDAVFAALKARLGLEDAHALLHVARPGGEGDGCRGSS